MYCFKHGLGFVFAGVLAWLGFSTPVWSLPLPVANVDPTFEAKVLQVIQEHPEAIIESVQAYQNRQQAQQRLQQQAVVDQLYAQPQQLIGESPTRGAAKSQNLLIEFSDFECPFCAKAAGEVHDFVDQHSEAITFVYKHLPLTAIHEQALPAARAAWAAQQQHQFWAFHDALFAEQSKLGDQRYIEIANSLRLDVQQFNRDRNSDEALAAIRKDMDLAAAIDVSGTPFFIFNGAIQSLPLDFDQIAEQLQ